MTLLSYPKTEEYGQAPATSTLHTVGLSAFRPFAESAYALNKFSHWSLGTPLDESMKQSIDFMNYQINNPEVVGAQRVANVVSGLAGDVLDPIAIGFAGIGIKAAGKAANIGLGLVPDVMSGLTNGALTRESVEAAIKAEAPAFKNNKYAKYLPKDYHDMVEKSSESAGAFIGFGAPSTFNENYKADQNRLDYGGVAKSIALNGGIGLAFPPLMWAIGLIGGKIGAPKIAEGVSKEAAAIDRIKLADKALEEGKISKEEHEFYTQYHANPGDLENHKSRALNILNKENHPVNGLTGDVEFPFLTQEEMTQMQTFATDQLAGTASEDYKRAMTNIVGHNALDRMANTLREYPGMMDAMQGHLDELINRLSKKIEYLEKHDIHVDKSMTKGAEREQPISQSRLYNMMKDGKLSHREMPFAVPDNVRGLRLREVEIGKLERLAKDYDREFAKSNRMEFKKKASKVRQKIAEKQADLKAFIKKGNHIKTQSEELDHIQNKFIGKEKLPDKYQLDTDYLRLLDLAHVSSRARNLVEKIKMREAYEAQEAIHNVMSAILDAAKKGMANVADPNKVVNYLKERIETSAAIPVIMEGMEKKVADVNKAVGESADKKSMSIDEQVRAINENESLPSSTKEEFNLLQERMKQFKGSEETQRKLINCIMEAENVRI